MSRRRKPPEPPAISYADALAKLYRAVRLAEKDGCLACEPYHLDGKYPCRCACHTARLLLESTGVLA